MKVNKKKKRNKKILLILLMIISFVFSLNIFLKQEKIKSHEYINFLFNKNNYKYVLNKGLKLVSNIDFKDPNTFLDKKMNVKIKKEKEEKITLNDNYNQDDYTKITSYISNEEKTNENPVLYIYNTHQLETYSNSGIENTTINPNVMMASYLLKDKMINKKINTIVEDTNMAEFIKNTGVTHNQYYGSSRIFMKNAMNKYPSLKYFIDLHRDSIDKNISTITINNKNYARVLFVIGTSNKTYKENENVSNTISNIINEKYPKLSRGIFKRYVDDWPEAYNQDLSKNSILIELGAKDNTIDEVMNTIDALSYALSKYIKETKE